MKQLTEISQQIGIVPGQQLAVDQLGHAEDVQGMSRKGLQTRERLHVPYSNGVVPRSARQTAVMQHHQRVDVIPMSGQLVFLRVAFFSFSKE